VKHEQRYPRQSYQRAVISSSGYNVTDAAIVEEADPCQYGIGLASAIDRAFNAHNLAAGSLNRGAQRASNGELSGQKASRL